MYTAHRPAEPGFTYYRFAHFAMPFWTLFPNGPLEDNIIAQAWVPMDDTHTMSYYFSWKRRTPALGLRRSGEPIPYLDRATATLPNTTDWFGRWRPAANQSNDYLIDRDAQRTVSYSGIAEVFTQDSAVTESIGAISDRTLEHLAPSDLDDHHDTQAIARSREGAARSRYGASARRRSARQQYRPVRRSDRALRSVLA